MPRSHHELQNLLLALALACFATEEIDLLRSAMYGTLAVLLAGVTLCSGVADGRR